MPFIRINLFSQSFTFPQVRRDLFLWTPACQTPVAHSLSAGNREASQPASACQDISERHPAVDRSVLRTVSVPACWPVPERSAVTHAPGPVDLKPCARSSTTRPYVAVSRDISETPTVEAVRTPMSAGLTETVETVWPVLRMTAATESVATPVGEPSVGPTTRNLQKLPRTQLRRGY